MTNSVDPDQMASSDLDLHWVVVNNRVRVNTGGPAEPGYTLPLPII